MDCDAAQVRDFTLLTGAIEWAEDQIIYRYGGYAAAKSSRAQR